MLSYGALVRGSRHRRSSPRQSNRQTPSHRGEGTRTEGIERIVGTDPRLLEFAVLDTETTGLDPYADRICEVALMRMRGDGTVLDTYDTLVDPACPIPNSEFHGIGDADVRGAPAFALVAPELLMRMSGAVLVAHNLPFDARMLEAELRRAGCAPSGLAGLCTLTTSRAQLDLPSYRLDTLVRVLTGAPPPRAHWALADTWSCALVLLGLLSAGPYPLRYQGPPAPVLAVPEVARAGAVRSRVAAGEGASVLSYDEPPCGTEAWREVWRRRELDSARCAGRFTAAQRRRARLAAWWREAVRKVRGS